MSEFKDNPVAMPMMLDSESHERWLEEWRQAIKYYPEYKKQKEGMEDQGDIMSRQVGGNHYKRACQPWEIIEEWELNYWAGNIIKYVLRYPHKNGVEDLEKAKHYLEYLIKKEKDALTTARD